MVKSLKTSLPIGLSSGWVGSPWGSSGGLGDALGGRGVGPGGPGRSLGGKGICGLVDGLCGRADGLRGPLSFFLGGWRAAGPKGMMGVRLVGLLSLFVPRFGSRAGCSIGTRSLGLADNFVILCTNDWRFVFKGLNFQLLFVCRICSKIPHMTLAHWLRKGTKLIPEYGSSRREFSRGLSQVRRYRGWLVRRVETVVVCGDRWRWLIEKGFVFDMIPGPRQVENSIRFWGQLVLEPHNSTKVWKMATTF